MAEVKVIEVNKKPPEPTEAERERFAKTHGGDKDVIIPAVFVLGAGFSPVEINSSHGHPPIINIIYHEDGTFDVKPQSSI